MFWEMVGRMAAPGVAQAIVKKTNDEAMLKGDLQRLAVHDYATNGELLREAAARGWGAGNPTEFRRPYGELSIYAPVTNPMMPAPQPQAPAAAKPAGGIGKTLATLAALTLAGGAGAGGTYALLKDQMQAKPAAVDMVPKDVKINFKLDPDNGIQPGPVEVKPAEPPK